MSPTGLMRHQGLLKRQRNLPGFTLFELLITISIMGMVVIVVSSLFISTNQFNRDEQLRIDVGEDASRVLGPLDRVLREGVQIVTSADIGGTTYTTGTSTVVFSLPSIDGTGATIIGTNDTAVLTFDTSSADNLGIRLLVDPADNTYRPSQNTMVVDRVKDFYLRYTTDAPTASTTIGATVQVTKSVRGRAFTRTNILYAILRNHP